MEYFSDAYWNSSIVWGFVQTTIMQKNFPLQVFCLTKRLYFHYTYKIDVIMEMIVCYMICWLSFPLFPGNVSSISDSNRIVKPRKSERPEVGLKIHINFNIFLRHGMHFIKVYNTLSCHIFCLHASVYGFFNWNERRQQLSFT